jgi:hypothetical protein
MGTSPTRLTELNLEQGRPSADAAERRLRDGITTFRRTGVRFVRVIHGYGSTGEGGAIRKRARSVLIELKRGGRLQGFVPGERFGPADADAIALVALFPGLRAVSDWNAGNPGITIVVL